MRPGTTHTRKKADTRAVSNRFVEQDSVIRVAHDSSLYELVPRVYERHWHKYYRAQEGGDAFRSIVRGRLNFVTNSQVTKSGLRNSIGQVCLPRFFAESCVSVVLRNQSTNRKTRNSSAPQ